MENKEIIEEVVEIGESTEQEVVDPRKHKFIVHTFRDVNMMKSFVKFDTRVRHPRAQFNMIILGIGCYVFAFRIEGLKMPAIVIACLMGTLLIGLAVFRHNMSLASMRSNPQVKENEELFYYFGNSGVRSLADGEEIKLGNYKDIYKVWEDEFNFYIGFDSEDLVVLPKCDFVEGDFREFCDFILEKTGAAYRWTPSLLSSRFKLTVTNLRMKMTGVDPNGNLIDNNSNKKKDKKK